MPASREQTLRINDATSAAWNAHDAGAVAEVFAMAGLLAQLGVG